MPALVMPIRSADLGALLYQSPSNQTNQSRDPFGLKGRRIITALLAACYADVEQLTKIADANPHKIARSLMSETQEAPIPSVLKRYGMSRIG
jgi:hypothetical protein